MTVDFPGLNKAGNPVKGGRFSRDPAALCRRIGPDMAAEMLGKESLLASETHDRSAPVLTTSTDSLDTTPVPKNSFLLDRGHVDYPREGESLPEAFKFVYVTPSSFDKFIRLSLRSGDGQVVDLDALKLDGNSITKMIRRPTLTSRAQYRFCVEEETADSNFDPVVSFNVTIA